MIYVLRRYHALITGVCLLTVCIVLSIWTPFELLMNERLRMRKGFPPYEWWLKPPSPTLKIYIFNVTNPERFLNGSDSKLNLEEIGPVVFDEEWLHSNVIFNSNSTITYNVKKMPKYNLNKNHLNLNSIVTVPNMALLGSASYLSNGPFIAKYAFRSLISMLGTKPFVNLTIENFLYNFTDPLLKFVHTYLPSMAPTDNIGVLDNLYQPYGDNVTAFIGPKNGHSKFSLIERYNGEITIPGHGEECKDLITGASEAVTFNQFITKEQDLKYYRKMLCRVGKLIYKKDVKRYGLTAYKFIVPKEVFNRSYPLEEDCYKSDPLLMDGLSDLSNCLYSFPLAGSFPHFLFGDGRLKNEVNGLKPNETNHQSYVIVEPITGLPLEEKAMIQLNIQIKNLIGFNSILQKFSNTIVPMFWLEFSVLNLPMYVLSLIYFVVIVQYVQWVLVIILLWIALRMIKKSLHGKINFLRKKDKMEREGFLMKGFNNVIER